MPAQLYHHSVYSITCIWEEDSESALQMAQEFSVQRVNESQYLQ